MYTVVTFTPATYNAWLAANTHETNNFYPTAEQLLALGVPAGALLVAENIPANFELEPEQSLGEMACYHNCLSYESSQEIFYVHKDTYEIFTLPNGQMYTPL